MFFIKICLAAMISFMFVFILHSLYNYLQDSLTTPKTKDFVDIPEREYKNIYKTLRKQYKKDYDLTGKDLSENQLKESNASVDSTKNELKQYFKQLNKTSTAAETQMFNSFEDVSTSLSYIDI